MLYDGNPGHPDLDGSGTSPSDAGITTFGTSAAFIAACMKAGIEPGAGRDLSRAAGGRLDRLAALARGLRLGLRAARRRHLAVLDQRRHRRLHGVRRRRAHAAGLRGRAAGARARAPTVEAFDADGEAARRRGRRARHHPADAVDAGLLLGRRGRRAATARATSTMYPGVWRHGDWIEITDRGTAIIYGRSRLDDQPRRRPDGDERDLPRGAGARRDRRRARRRRARATGDGELDAAVRRAARRRRARRRPRRADRAGGSARTARRATCPNEVDGGRRGAADALGQGARGAGQADPDGRRRRSRRRAATRWRTPRRSTSSSSSAAAAHAAEDDPHGAGVDGAGGRRG